MSEFRPVTLITGASTGIGAELARVFARNGHDLVLTARSEDKLNRLADELAANGKRPLVIPADVAVPGAAEALRTAMMQLGVEPQYLVNNAGFGLVGLAEKLDRAEQLSMIDLNVRALTDFALTFVDPLARHRGGMLNVASIAAFAPGPGCAVYYATKAYVLSLSEALSAELEPRGVRVTCLCPGPVPTDFARRAGIPPGTQAPGILSYPADKVAEEGYAALMAGKRRHVAGLAPRILAGVMRVLPRDLALRLVAYRQNRRRVAQNL